MSKTGPHRARENRRNFSHEQREKEQDRARENRQRNSEQQREKEVVNKGGELVMNSENAKEKGNGKAGEEITQVMQRKEKEKVCKFNFSFTVNYLKILLSLFLFL